MARIITEIGNYPAIGLDADLRHTIPGDLSAPDYFCDVALGKAGMFDHE